MIKTQMSKFSGNGFDRVTDEYLLTSAVVVSLPVMLYYHRVVNPLGVNWRTSKLSRGDIPLGIRPRGILTFLKLINRRINIKKVQNSVLYVKHYSTDQDNYVYILFESTIYTGQVIPDRSTT